MAIIGVIDLREGRAVHAIGGERAIYRPVSLPLTPDGHQPTPGDPAALLAFYQRRGVASIYVADLDAISGRTVQTAAVASLATRVGRLLVDAGPSGPALARSLTRRTGALVSPVLATEWLASPAEAIRHFADAEDLTPWWSLDLAGEAPWRASPAWHPDDPSRFWALLETLPGSQWIVLDLTAVGTASGPRAVPAMRRLRSLHPGATILVGGGVRHQVDVEAVAAAGGEGVLVSTALLRGETLVPAKRAGVASSPTTDES